MERKILLIDNYDSFTYILAHYLESAGAEVFVYKNDEIDASEALALSPDYLVLSPGPGRPEVKKDMGNTREIFEALFEKIPVLGVCLGHQFIASCFGAQIVKAPAVMHGKTSEIGHCGEGLFYGLKQPLDVMRYHSLLIEDLPDVLVETASFEGLNMAYQHKELPIYGVQFHPESVGTEMGAKLIENFLSL